MWNIAPQPPRYLLPRGHLRIAATAPAQRQSRPLTRQSPVVKQKGVLDTEEGSKVLVRIVGLEIDGIAFPIPSLLYCSYSMWQSDVRKLEKACGGTRVDDSTSWSRVWTLEQ